MLAIARTKETARRSTGGRALRKKLAKKDARNLSAPPDCLMISGVSVGRFFAHFRFMGSDRAGDDYWYLLRLLQIGQRRLLLVTDKSERGLGPTCIAGAGNVQGGSWTSLPRSAGACPRPSFWRSEEPWKLRTASTWPVRWIRSSTVPCRIKGIWSFQMALGTVISDPCVTMVRVENRRDGISSLLHYETSRSTNRLGFVVGR